MNNRVKTFFDVCFFSIIRVESRTKHCVMFKDVMITTVPTLIANSDIPSSSVNSGKFRVLVDLQ